jgi:hypothetical protein
LIELFDLMAGPPFSDRLRILVWAASLGPRLRGEDGGRHKSIVIPAQAGIQNLQGATTFNLTRLHMRVYTRIHANHPLPLYETS